MIHDDPGVSVLPNKQVKTVQPGYDPSVSILPKKQVKKFQPGASHVIYEYEGSYFPGLVTELNKKSLVVKTMAKTGARTWSWPEREDYHTCHVDDIVHLIPPPVLVNNRGQGYLVENIADYW